MHTTDADVLALLDKKFAEKTLNMIVTIEIKLIIILEMRRNEKRFNYEDGNEII